MNFDSLQELEFKMKMKQAFLAQKVDVTKREAAGLAACSLLLFVACLIQQ